VFRKKIISGNHYTFNNYNIIYAISNLIRFAPISLYVSVFVVYYWIYFLLCFRTFSVIGVYGCCVSTLMI